LPNLCVTVDWCFPLPENLSYDEGAFCEPLSVGVHAVRRGGVSVGKRVAVLGAGPIGLVTLMSARVFGADAVVATDLSARKLDVAVQCGVSHPSACAAALFMRLPSHKTCAAAALTHAYRFSVPQFLSPLSRRTIQCTSRAATLLHTPRPSCAKRCAVIRTSSLIAVASSHPCRPRWPRAAGARRGVMFAIIAI
jgi:hypothetical protein